MKKLLLATSLLLPLSSFAQSVAGRLTITPIVGVERVQKIYPTSRMETRTILGARAVYKFPISSLEVEYTHAEDDEVIGTTKYEDAEDKLRVGLRGSFNAGSFLGYYIRGGAQGRKNEHTETVNGLTSTSKKSSKVQPYVGTGLEIKLLQYFSLSADLLATYTPTDDPNLKDYELQPSLGLNLRF